MQVKLYYLKIVKLNLHENSQNAKITNSELKSKIGLYYNIA